MAQVPDDANAANSEGAETRRDFAVGINDGAFIVIVIAIMAVDVIMAKTTVNIFFGVMSVALQFLLIKILGRVLNVKEADNWLEIFTPKVFDFSKGRKRG